MFTAEKKYNMPPAQAPQTLESSMHAVISAFSLSI